MRLTKDIRSEAERTIELSVDDARRLPGMLGRIVPNMMIFHGFYTCVLDNVKTLYVATDSKDALDAMRRAATPNYAARSAMRENTLKVGR